MSQPAHKSLQHPAPPSEQSTSQSESAEAAALERKSLSAREVHAAILLEGEEELERTASALWWSGLAAGLSMGFSLVAEGLVRAALPDTAWRPLVAKLGYTVGFFIVVLGRQQLFTENTLTAVLPVLTKRSPGTLTKMLRLWGIVLLANLVGAAVFAWATAATPAFDWPVRQVFVELGMEASAVTFGTALIKGVYAGWLIALMVWLLPAADTAKPIVVIVLTYLVGLGHLTHIIAGSVEVLYVVFSGGLPFTAFLAYMVPTLLGNIAGGVLFVALLNHKQATQ